MRPLRQGGLDRLCGIYAVVNATRIATRRCGRLNNDDCLNLFAYLATHVNDREQLVNALTCGIGAQLLVRLVRATNDWLTKKRGIRMEVHRPFYRCAPPSAGSFVAKLDQHLRTANTAAIISMQYHCLHWTVVQRVTDSSLLLFDSAGYKRLSRRTISFQIVEDATVGRRIFPNEVFFIRAKT